MVLTSACIWTSNASCKPVASAVIRPPLICGERSSILRGRTNPSTWLPRQKSTPHRPAAITALRINSTTSAGKLAAFKAQARSGSGANGYRSLPAWRVGMSASGTAKRIDWNSGSPTCFWAISIPTPPASNPSVHQDRRPALWPLPLRSSGQRAGASPSPRQPHKQNPKSPQTCNPLTQ